MQMNVEPPPSGYRWSNIIPLLLPEPPKAALIPSAPSWPRKFETTWQPEPDRPTYRLAGTTREISKTIGHFAVKDVREITFRVLGSEQRRVNDWQDWRICVRGRALPLSVVPALWNSSDNMVVIFCDQTPLVVIAINLTVAGIRHIATPKVWGQTDLTLAESNFTTVAPINHNVTKREEQMVSRGQHLLSTFTTTMTARGRPGSGTPEEKRQELARQRLAEAGHDLLDDDVPSPVTAQFLACALGITERAVYLMIERADWQIEDVQEASNSLHMRCRNAE